jgi:DNA-binding CsgD family transcriptional regulator
MDKSPSARILTQVIGAIYDCALDPCRWEEALAQIRDVLNSRTAVLHLNDMRGHRILIYGSVGISSAWQDQIVKHTPEIHARFAQDLASWPSLDEPHVVSRHVPRSYRETSPYIQECLKPNGIVDVMTYFLLHTPSRLAGFAVGRHEQQGIITEREIELGALLLPHVRRAVAISNMLDVCTIERVRITEALDALRCGVALTNARGIILHANRSAEQMLREGRLIYSTGGMLRAKDQTAAAELQTAIEWAALDEVGIGKTGLAIRLSDTDGPPVFARVLPMNGGELRTRLEPTAVAAVFIGTSPDEQDAVDMMATTYGLTTTEARVLASLLAGSTLAETAAALGVASTTARTHLDKIFSKTGVTRQADLIRLGARFAAPTGAAS